MDETTGKPVLCPNAAGYGAGRENKGVWRAGETDGEGAEGVYCGGKMKMENEYMFFSKQEFADISLDEYIKKDINISKTEIHIYQFEYKNGKENDDKAKKLDKLTNIFKEKFPEQFVLISSESSQYFCSILYPLVSKFETQLRYALYISRALYNSKEIDVSSFLFEIDKNNKKKIEELDFGKIYETVFTDKDLQDKIKKLSGEKLSKTDLIKNIQSWKENTMWQDIVGKDYSYIEENFLKIKEFRNHVMHSHLIDYNTYKEAKEVLELANKELEKAIKDKLIVNKSTYLNNVNINFVINDYFNSEEFKQTINNLNELNVRLNNYFNSEEFKQTINNLNETFNDKKFRQALDGMSTVFNNYYNSKQLNNSLKMQKKCTSEEKSEEPQNE